MKLIKTLIAASVLVAGSASAITLDHGTSSTNVRVAVEDGVATLYGTVDSNSERFLLEQAAAKIEGVDEVRNLLFFSM